jgi:hypothetical protein
MTISDNAAKRVNRPSPISTENTSSPQVAANQFNSVGRALNGHGKPFCQSAHGMSANQFSPRSLVVPDSQNSQNRISRRANGHR